MVQSTRYAYFCRVRVVPPVLKGGAILVADTAIVKLDQDMSTGAWLVHLCGRLF
jgi:hypothetical protein